LVIIGASTVLLAAIIAAMAFGWTSKAKRYADPALEHTFHPMAQTPSTTPSNAATAAAASIPNVPNGTNGSAVYREWLPQAGGWILADAQCVPLRGSFIADPAPRALPVGAPRAQLIRLPVRRATLVQN
jgi:hypothetical protein